MSFFPLSQRFARLTPGTVLVAGLLAAYVLLVVVWLVFPIALVVISSFQGRLEVDLNFSSMSLDAYRAITPNYWEAFWFTVRTALVATFTALLIAIPAAWAMIRGRLRGRRVLSSMVLIPDVVPQIVLGIALLTVFIPLKLSNSFAGILLALTALSLSTGLRFSEALLEGIPEEYEAAALSLGASRLTVFRLVTIPLIAPGVAITALFIFMQNLITFELLFFVAGPSATPISVRLFTDIVERGAMPHAIAMAAILVYVAIAFYAVVAIILGPKYMAGAIISRKG